MTTLLRALDEYLALRRGLGFKLRDHESALRDFITFVCAQGGEFITTAMALAWTQRSSQVTLVHRAHRLAMVRDFARYRIATDPRTQIPPSGLVPARSQRRQPYIYSEDQIRSLIHQALRLEPPDGLRAHTYSTLFGLLAVTGMRVGETVALDCADADLTRGVLTVRAGKFNKTRSIPVHDSTQRKLQVYARRRERVVPRPSTNSFFLSDQGRRLNYCAVRSAFIGISHLIGLRNATDRHGPRLHDLRHTFAVRTLTNWYRAGIDPEERLPLLSAYLGHAKVSDTYWYLSAVPELLGSVGTRLENYLGGLS